MDLSARTVLVVEDHDFQRRMELNILRALGAQEVLEAVNGRAALDLLEAREGFVDIIVCDLDMPEMDGIEFIGHLAERKLAGAVVVASGMEASILHTVETMARAYGLQVLGAIEKPITSQALSECLDRYRVPEAVGEDAAGEVFTVEDLHQGLANREFVPFFQPKVSFASGAPLGVETLVRWFRPGKGVLAPMAFIPSMEQAGLVTALTESLLQQTCSYLRAWDARGLDLAASMNVSMDCFADVGIADRLDELVRGAGCAARRITLEVTETELMADVAKVLNVLARLRLKGFGLSIDDFGTGYSSLQQLSHVPFTELKIDQSFVKEAPAVPRRRAMVETSLDLARKLNLRTVAEGIETRAEWDLLKSLGCGEAQGFFVARPMPGHLIPDWVQLWQAPEAMLPL